MAGRDCRRRIRADSVPFRCRSWPRSPVLHGVGIFAQVLHGVGVFAHSGLLVVRHDPCPVRTARIIQLLRLFRMCFSAPQLPARAEGIWQVRLKKSSVGTVGLCAAWYDWLPVKLEDVILCIRETKVHQGGIYTRCQDPHVSVGRWTNQSRLIVLRDGSSGEDSAEVQNRAARRPEALAQAVLGFFSALILRSGAAVSTKFSGPWRNVLAGGRPGSQLTT